MATYKPEGGRPVAEQFVVASKPTFQRRQRTHQTANVVLRISILNVILGIASICIGIVAMSMDSDYKEIKSAYWSSNSGIAIGFGGMILLTALVGAICCMESCKNGVLGHAGMGKSFCSVNLSVLDGLHRHSDEAADSTAGA